MYDSILFTTFQNIVQVAAVPGQRSASSIEAGTIAVDDDAPPSVYDPLGWTRCSATVCLVFLITPFLVWLQLSLSLSA